MGRPTCGVRLYVCICVRAGLGTGMKHFADGSTMETYSGRAFSFAEPDPDDVYLVDVAHHLAQVNRFTGATRHPYSVAEHAVRVARRLGRIGSPPALCLAGLHHDDVEAYTGDLNRPFKQSLGPMYKAHERNLERVVREGLGLLWLPFSDPAVKSADNWAVIFEARRMLPSRGDGWIIDLIKDDDPDDGDVGTSVGLSSRAAEQSYLAEHQYLLEQAMRAKS